MKYAIPSFLPKKINDIPLATFFRASVSIGVDISFWTLNDLVVTKITEKESSSTYLPFKADRIKEGARVKKKKKRKMEC